MMFRFSVPQILIAVAVGWLFYVIQNARGVLSANTVEEIISPTSERVSIAPWFSIPYPGEFQSNFDIRFCQYV